MILEDAMFTTAGKALLATGANPFANDGSLPVPLSAET